MPSSAPERSSGAPRFSAFLWWLVVFYLGWVALVVGGGHWETVLHHWPIALAMALGSYVAGSTPMGGGTVGFPVLVLLFDLPSSIGRHFGLAVQSIGMVSASIYLFSARRPISWRLLRPAFVGALVATPLGAAYIAPMVPDLWTKLLFAVVWAGFGLMHLVKLPELVAAEGIATLSPALDRRAGLVIGLTGGVVASVTGVGIDMLLYATMVLLYRADLKISIPTSVVLMAFTSVVGIGANVVLARLDPARYTIDPEVFGSWLAAAPIVALGAPIGALVVEHLPRSPTLYAVSALCVGQFVWTLVHENVRGSALIAALVGLVLVNAAFHLLYRWGRRAPRAGRSPGRPSRFDSPPSP